MAPLHSKLFPAALALSLFGAPVMAQAPQVQAEGVGSPMMKQAMEGKFSDAHIEVATQVLQASGMTTIFQNAVPNVVGSLRVNYTRMRPELTKDIEESLRVVDAESIKVTDEGVKAAARFLAVRMGEKELREVQGFLTSPVGKKYVASLPGLTEDIVPFVELWGQEVAGRLMAVFTDEMARRGHKF